jgi:hypothetical protein
MSSLHVEGYEPPMLVEIGDLARLTQGVTDTGCMEWWGVAGAWVC